MVELCIPKNRVFFLFFDFDSFWRENDVTRLTAELKLIIFKIWQNKYITLKECDVIETNVKIILEKLNEME